MVTASRILGDEVGSTAPAFLVSNGLYPIFRRPEQPGGFFFCLWL